MMNPRYTQSHSYYEMMDKDLIEGESVKLGKSNGFTMVIDTEVGERLVSVSKMLDKEHLVGRRRLHIPFIRFFASTSDV